MDLQELGRDHGLDFSGLGQGQVHMNVVLNLHVP